MSDKTNIRVSIPEMVRLIAKTAMGLICEAMISFNSRDGAIDSEPTTLVRGYIKGVSIPEMVRLIELNKQVIKIPTEVSIPEMVRLIETD